MNQCSNIDEYVSLVLSNSSPDNWNCEMKNSETILYVNGLDLEFNFLGKTITTNLSDTENRTQLGPDHLGCLHIDCLYMNKDNSTFTLSNNVSIC